jgi:hypothetical protein
MCPDHQMLSVYLDGELPSPWKEKMEKHLSVCPQCRERLSAYREISQRAAGSVPEGGAVSEGESILEAAKERVWFRLQNLTAGEICPRRSPGFWSGSVSVPLPAAAAAAVILVVAFAAAGFRRNAGTLQLQDMAAAGVDLDVRGIMPVSDMNGVLQYLGDKDTGDIVILRLPESRNFMSSGEPTILKAAELPARIPMGPAPSNYPSGRNTPR